MSDSKEYINALSAALQARKDWLEKSELANLKENLRIYQASFASLYSIFLKKKLINEDPYKQEAKISELEIPETGAFNEAKRIEQISIRLSNFDNQLDFLVNFYQFGVDFLNLERIKRIIGLVRYIDWNQLIPESQYTNTRAVAEITIQSKAGLDPIALSVVGESLVKLPKSTTVVMGILKNLALYHREAYKLNIRNAITQDMSIAEANAANIRKKIAAEMPGTPYYQELIDEILKEDFSGQGPALRENILNSLKFTAEKPKTAKKAISYKSFLIDGLRVIGGTAPTLDEIMQKMDTNDNILANQKKTVWQKIKIAFKQMLHNEPDEKIVDIEYMDPIKAVPVRQKLNYNQFHADLEKKIRILSGMGFQGSAAARMDSMSEEQLVALLEKTVREVQIIHRTLTALDEYFKAEAPKELRDRIKGIRPELASVKNNFIKANQMRHEYSAQKEEEEQMKRLGITPTA